jgi:hypothetical protein
MAVKQPAEGGMTTASIECEHAFLAVFQDAQCDPAEAGETTRSGIDARCSVTFVDVRPQTQFEHIAA